MDETDFFVYDKGSPTDSGYPWKPQVSRIPTLAVWNKWDTTMWNDIIDGRTFKFAGGTHNVANFTPEQFRNVLDSYLVNRMGTFKCFAQSQSLGLTNLMDMYGILTTIKPWTDESGGGLKQRFETSDVIFKRYQIDATTWSAWVCIQNKDVDIIKLFQSVSNGKAVVNQAVTDMGVYTAPDATFATTANNIRLLSTAKKGVGTYYFESYQTVFRITGLDFTPRVITFRTRATTDRFWGTYNADFTTSEFQVTANGASHGNVFSVFYGGFEVRVAHPTVNSGAMFDWFVSK